MELAYRKLSDAEVATELSSTPNWSVDDGQLCRTFHFDHYLDGARFAWRIAETADALNHHPDLTIGYDKVGVRVNTHDVGALSPFDFELARRIDALN